MENFEDTQPTKVTPSQQIPAAPDNPTPLPPGGDVPVLPEIVKPPRKPRRWPWVLMGIFLVLASVGLGGYIGYADALQLRSQRQEGQVALAATTQYQLGLAELQKDQLENARTRFEYVIRLDPNFPGAKEKLMEVTLKQAQIKTSTPVVTPTITVTPTPDNRGTEDLFNQAASNVHDKKWDDAINTLDALRKVDKTYRAVDADGYYYIALRNRGVDKITLQANLEGGMYDLAQAELFAPIDRDADGYRTWARLYLTGASFWGVDWPKVLEIFSQIYPSLPNLRDGSGWTAAERYRIAAMSYGDQLMQKGEYCMARDQYANSLTVGNNPKLGPTATAAQKLCSPPTATPKPTTIVPTDAEIPTSEPTIEATTEIPPPAPTNTPETPAPTATP
jgi:tetratricopeptide (TPR) repeat protein